MEDNKKSESEIRQRYQTTVPQDIREKMGLEIGDSLIWTYDSEKDEIRIIKKPESFADVIWGLGLLSMKEEQHREKDGEDVKESVDVGAVKK